MTTPSSDVARSLLREPAVRHRILEFLGETALAGASARYVVRATPDLRQPFDPRPVTELWTLLEEYGEAARSLWDRERLLVDLDVEHVHYDRALEPLVHPRRSRRLQAPVVAAIEALLDEYGISSIHLLTGRGHRWVWSIPHTSRCCAELANVGILGLGLRKWYARPQPPLSDAVGLAIGAAYAGLGQSMELLGHRILAATDSSPLPVELTAAAVPAGPAGRETISIDFSLYGDPLDRRTVRIPFTPYRKGLPPRRRSIFTVPVAAGREKQAFAAVSDPAAAADLARTVSTAIPDAAAGTLRLLRDYVRSDLAEIHRDFYVWVPDPPEDWHRTYDRLDLSTLPPCVARVLEQPNDLLLRPAAIQLVVRALLALGWVPRHIAGLLRSKLERDPGWIPQVHFHEPECRAEFYVRLFTGLALCRPGDLRDFDCITTKGRSLCPPTSCPCLWDLCDLRVRLKGR